jgi:hypothetical protein
MLLEWWRKATLCKRHWVLSSESLCTELIQYTHDSTMTEHSERDVTDALLSQQFFWPEMLQNVCTFCEIVTNAVWTTAEKMLTRLLEAFTCIKQIWQKIFIDFVVDLLSSEGCTNLLIITDCLSKKVILNCARIWLQNEWLRHLYNISMSSWAFMQ